MIPRIAVVPTHDRPAELARLLDAIAPQCNAVFAIDNASTPPVDHNVANRGRPQPVHVIRDEEQPPNLSRLWNVGLDAAATWARVRQVEVYDVAVLNDDAVPPPGWWDAVSAAMRSTTAEAACSDPYGVLARPQLKTAPDNDVMGRLCGWAFMLRGETGLRFDERLRWWWSDTQIDWDARAAGGMIMIPGFHVGNTGANTSTTGALAEQAGRDRATFETLYGRAPW